MLFLVVYGVIFKVKSIVEKRYFFLVLYLLFIYKEDFGNWCFFKFCVLVIYLMINKVGESVFFLIVFVGLNGSKEDLGI